MLFVALDFENYLTVDGLVNSRTNVSAIARIELDTIKQKAPNKVLKIDNPPIFQIKVANGPLKNR